MVEHGANVKAINKKGKNPYDCAVEWHYEKVADYLNETQLTIKLKEDDISSDEKK